MRAVHPQSVFVGVSGASGAPYALRLLQALHACGCRLELCISDMGIVVLDHELELGAGGGRGGAAGASGVPPLAVDRAAVTAAFLARAGVTATVYDPADLAAPPASGSAGPDAVVVCPCSMSTAATIALGTTRTLIHRVGDVALKERRPLVVVPRETPLLAIHLRRLLELSEAGAVVVPAMPAFYHRPHSLADAVDHIVGKVLTTLGFEQTLFPPWDGGAD